MTKKKMEKLFELAEELYSEEVKKAGMTTIPFCWAENHLSGGLIVFAPFGKDADDIKEKLLINT